MSVALRSIHCVRCFFFIFYFISLSLFLEKERTSERQRSIDYRSNRLTPLATFCIYIHRRAVFLFLNVFSSMMLAKVAVANDLFSGEVVLLCVRKPAHEASNATIVFFLEGG